MPNIQYGQWNQDGATEYALGADAACHSKVFYVSGLTVTKRKTGIRAQGGTSLKNMAAPCTTTATLAMSVIFKGNSEMWPELFKKRFTVPVSSYSYSGWWYNSPANFQNYTFYNSALAIVSYFSPSRKFWFSLSNIGVCLPKEFFNITVDLPVPTVADPNPEQKTYYAHPHITSENLQYLTASKKTPTTFNFKSFEWNSGYSYSYNSLSRALARPDQDPFWYIAQEKTTALETRFEENNLGVFPSFSFLASDYCYEIENGNLYFREMTLVPSDPELSDIMGIESITCKLTNSI